MSTRLVSVLATREVIHLRVSCDCPPIPYRGLDYSAVDDNTYDCDFIGGEDDEWSCGTTGNGETESEAIADLLEKLEDR